MNCRRAFPVKPWLWRSVGHLPSVHFYFAETRAPSAFKAFVVFFSEVLFFFFAEALVAPFFGAELTLCDTVGEAPDAAKPALSGVTPIFFSLSHNNDKPFFFFFSKPHAVSSCASIVGFFVKSACKTVSPR